VADEAVLWAVGRHLGRVAGHDLAARCRGDADRAGRKRVLTVGSSSRWAGAVTRTSNDQWERAFKNLLVERAGLHRAIRTIQARLAAPAGGRDGRARGYATQAERSAKQRRLQHLRARLAEVDRRLLERRVSVCRGGRRLANLRHHLGDADLTKAEWQARWQAGRLFLTADGEAEMAWGNQTIRVHPDEQWLELRLPTPLAHLSNTPGRAVTYRLRCPVVFHHRSGEWAAQAASGAVRYDIAFDPARGRWYLDASWQVPKVLPPSPAELRRQRALGVDLNANHLDCWPLTLPATRSARRIPSRWYWLAWRPAPATATFAGRSAPAFASLVPLVAGRSWSRTSTSLTPARLAGRPLAAAGVASSSAAASAACRRAGSASCWLAWPPTPGCGWWR
jgi:hypothetical protein